MELSRHYGSGLVDHSFIALVVEVDEVWLPSSGKSIDVNGVTVVLRGDVASAGGEIESWDIVCSVSVLELDCSSASGKSEKLVAETDTHDRAVVGFDQLSEMVDGGSAVGWVSWSVRDEDSVEMVSDLVDWVVPWETGNGSSAANEGAEDVFLDTTVDDCNMEITGGGNMERCLGRDLGDQVDLFRVDESLVLVGVIFFSDSDSGEG